MKRTALLLTGALVATALVACAPAVEAQPATASVATYTAPPRPMLVIGDSITYGVSTPRRYTRTPGDPMRAWYSFAAERAGVPVVINAQPGSGFINKGYGIEGKGRCSGKNFGQRTAWSLNKWRPGTLVIEGAWNDVYRCNADRTLRRTKNKDFVKAVKSYMSHLRVDIKKVGMTPSDVYVISPWGETQKSEAWRIRSTMRKYALLNGFNWISTGFIPRSQTLDGGHPNEAGVQYLVGQIAKNSDLMDRR